MTVKEIKEVKERTAASSLFQREKRIAVNGVEFMLRRMTLREELEWYRERDSILQNQDMHERDKVVYVWESLLKRVVEEPKLSSYTEELPAVVVAKLIDEITKLHMWDLDFTTYKRG